MSKSRSPNPQDAIVVDRLLRQLQPHPDHRASTSSVRPRPRPYGARAAAVTSTPVAVPSALVVWGRAALGAVLAGALTQWPYEVCGFPLAGYLIAVLLVLVTAGWAAYDAWRVRMGRAHIIAIGTLLAGFALGALELLPRLGYAGLDVAWRCIG